MLPALPMRTVLLIDDQADVREVLRLLLEREGFRALEAGDGVEALRLLRQNEPHLIILDLLMPQMDGYEFLDQVPAGIPLIVMSGVDERLGARSRTLSHAGIRSVLRKPVGIDEIRKAVRDALPSS